MAAPTLIIDDPENGGSEPGAWARALRHTEFTNPARTVARDTAGLGTCAPAAVGDGLASPPFGTDPAKPGHHRNHTSNPERGDQ